VVVVVMEVVGGYNNNNNIEAASSQCIAKNHQVWSFSLWWNSVSGIFFGNKSSEAAAIAWWKAKGCWVFKKINWVGFVIGSWFQQQC
jgi:hypothetical protein